jgi:uncharacterized protein YjbJ (UPF0337 family)
MDIVGLIKGLINKVFGSSEEMIEVAKDQLAEVVDVDGIKESLQAKAEELLEDVPDSIKDSFTEKLANIDVEDTKDQLAEVADKISNS